MNPSTSSILSGLNDEQRDAAQCTAQHIAIVAALKELQQPTSRKTKSKPNEEQLELF